jgi:transcriptional regulator with XRE-family HTH domain
MAKPPKRADSSAPRAPILTPEDCRTARTALSWTLLRLAIAADVSPTAVWLFENHRRTPIPNTLSALRRALEGAGYEFSNPADDQMRALFADIERLHEQAAQTADADEAKKVLEDRDRLVRLMWRIPTATRPGKVAKVKVAVLLLGWRGASEDLPLAYDLARRLLGELAGLTAGDLEKM